MQTYVIRGGTSQKYRFPHLKYYTILIRFLLVLSGNLNLHNLI